MSDAASTLLIVDDDPQVSLAIASALHRPGRQIIVCSDAESAEVVIDTVPIDALLADLRLSERFRFEGVELLEHARRSAPAARLIAMSGSSLDGLRHEIEHTGGSFVAKPFETAALERMIPAAAAEPAGDYPIAFVPTLERIVAGNLIVPRFQRIVTLDGGATYAVEALARLSDSRFDVAALFRYAERKQQTIELNIACLERAIATSGRVPAEQMLFINVDPTAFAQPQRLTRSVFGAAERAELDLRRLVIELTEQHPFPEHAEAFAAVEALRDAGVRFALDDLGVSYSHLSLIDRLRPSFFKISQAIGTAFDTDPTRRTIVRSLTALASDLGCATILEGIESESTAAAACDEGIALGQGFLFGDAVTS